MVKWLVNEMAERMWEALSWSNFRTHAGVCVEGFRMITKTSFMVVGIPAGIRTEKFPGPNKKRFRWSHLAGSRCIKMADKDSR
jgi:hypothetical protein